MKQTTEEARRDHPSLPLLSTLLFVEPEIKLALSSIRLNQTYGPICNVKQYKQRGSNIYIWINVMAHISLFTYLQTPCLVQGFSVF